MRLRSAGIGAGLLLALAFAAPAAANTTDRFSFDEGIVQTFSCGVVMTTAIHGDVTAHLDANGEWLFSGVRIRYDGRATDPDSGATLTLSGRQVVTETADLVAMRGQGTFLRIPVKGVVLWDVGRLVFDPSDGSTISATPKVIPFDDPDAAAQLDAAACSLFD